MGAAAGDIGTSGEGLRALVADVCKKINVREQISITAEIELNQSVCKSPFSFEIHIFGQSHSNMVVKVNPICECEDCPRENNHAPCNTNGDSDATKVCGACQCVNNQGE